MPIGLPTSSSRHQDQSNLFIIVNLFQVVIEGIRKACSDERSLRVVGNTLHVAFALEEFERESVVEDRGAASGRRLSPLQFAGVFRWELWPPEQPG